MPPESSPFALEWLTVVVTLGAATLSAAAAIIASVLSQAQARRSALTQYWAQRRVDVHKRFLEAMAETSPQLVSMTAADGRDAIDTDVLTELESASLDVELFGSAKSADLALSYLDGVRNSIGLALPDDQGDRYQLAEMVNDGCADVRSEYLDLVRHELGIGRLDTRPAWLRRLRPKERRYW